MFEAIWQEKNQTCQKHSDDISWLQICVNRVRITRSPESEGGRSERRRRERIFGLFFDFLRVLRGWNHPKSFPFSEISWSVHFQLPTRSRNIFRPAEIFWPEFRKRRPAIDYTAPKVLSIFGKVFSIFEKVFFEAGKVFSKARKVFYRAERVFSKAEISKSVFQGWKSVFHFRKSVFQTSPLRSVSQFVKSICNFLESVFRILAFLFSNRQPPRWSQSDVLGARVKHSGALFNMSGWLPIGK